MSTQTTTAKPTACQAALIRYFDGGPAPQGKIRQSTYETCRQRGWIERSDEFPFHRTTELGRQALTPSAPNTAPATARRQRIGDEKRAEILRSHGWTVIPPEQAK